MRYSRFEIERAILRKRSSMVLALRIKTSEGQKKGKNLPGRGREEKPWVLERQITHNKLLATKDPPSFWILQLRRFHSLHLSSMEQPCAYKTISPLFCSKSWSFCFCELNPRHPWWTQYFIYLKAPFLVPSHLIPVRPQLWDKCRYPLSHRRPWERESWVFQSHKRDKKRH